MVRKIGWFPGGPKEIASVRVRSYYIIDFLKDHGIEVLINNQNPDVLVFQKCLSEDKLAIALKSKRNGKRLIYDISDNVRQDMAKYLPFFEIAKNFILNVDKVVVNGIGLKQILVDKFRRDAVIIEDFYPIPNIRKIHEGHKPKLIWHGYFKNMLMYVFGKFMSDFDVELWKKSGAEQPIDFRKLSYDLITVANSEFSLRFLLNRPTHLHPQGNQLYYMLLEGDIGISPMRLWDEDCFGKSSNKIVSYMMLGLPIVASPIPAYSELIINGENGFLASDKKEWLTAIEKLGNLELRKRIGDRGYKTVVDKFSLKTIGGKWLNLLKKID